MRVLALVGRLFNGKDETALVRLSQVAPLLSNQARTPNGEEMQGIHAHVSKQQPPHRRQALAHWNAARPVVDENGTSLPYENAGDLLVDLLEDASPLPTDLCLLIVGLMDWCEYSPLPQGKVVRLPPERVDCAEPQAGHQIRFRGGGCLIIPQGCREQKKHPQTGKFSVTKPELPAGCSSVNLKSSGQGKTFLFYREFPLSIEFMQQDGQTLLILYHALNPLDLEELPLKAEERRLRVFFSPVGHCEYRMRPCQTKPDPECVNACCCGSHCATYASACAHHDLVCE